TKGGPPRHPGQLDARAPALSLEEHARTELAVRWTAERDATRIARATAVRVAAKLMRTRPSAAVRVGSDRTAMKARSGLARASIKTTSLPTYKSSRLPGGARRESSLENRAPHAYPARMLKGRRSGSRSPWLARRAFHSCMGATLL